MYKILINETENMSGVEKQMIANKMSNFPHQFKTFSAHLYSRRDLLTIPFKRSGVKLMMVSRNSDPT